MEARDAVRGAIDAFASFSHDPARPSSSMIPDFFGEILGSAQRIFEVFFDHRE